MMMMRKEAGKGARETPSCLMKQKKMRRRRMMTMRLEVSPVHCTTMTWY